MDDVKLGFLDGGGLMGEAVRRFDWAKTPLGAIAGWPPPLKTAVGMTLSSRFPKALVWGEGLTTIYNDAFQPILGMKPAPLGRAFSDVWAEVWDDIGPIMRRAFAGEATFIADFPLVTERNGAPEEAWFTFCYSPVRDADGRILGVMDTVMETTATVRTQRNIKLLNEELGHRLRNTLAMVAGIAQQSFRAAATKEEGKDIFLHRLAALGNAHAVLTDASWSGADVGAVVEGALEPHRSGINRIFISGPRLTLSARQALSLALALHELATNALKYGALSVPDGRVSVSWEAGAEAGFRLRWVEAGGPQVAAPERRGFGSRLITEALGADFSGTVEMTFHPAGLRVELVAPLAALADGRP